MTRSAFAIQDSLAATGDTTVVVLEGLSSDPSGFLTILFAAISAIAALVSVSVSAWYNWKESQWRRKEMEHKYYQILLANPAIEAVTGFREDSKSLLHEAEDAIEKLHAEKGAASEVTRIIGDLRDDFVDRQLRMMANLTEVAEAWGDNDIREELREAAEKVQEDVAKTFPTLAYTDTETTSASALNTSTGRVLQVVRENDPVFYDRTRDSEK